MSDIAFDWDFDERLGYSYHVNYWEDFFDASDQGPAVLAVLERDFVFNLADFLNGKFDTHLDTAFSIAKSVYHRMCAPELHFHTPAHVLSVFRFAFDHQIAMEIWEQLAIWFHDSIYLPGAPSERNELQSVSFMRGLVPNGVSCCDAALNRAERGIIHTGYHPAGKTEKMFANLMDLDLCYLAWPWPAFEKASGYLVQEFATTMTKRKYTTGFRRFYEVLLDRDKVFRTEEFQKRFEKAARQNIERVLRLLV